MKLSRLKCIVAFIGLTTLTQGAIAGRDVLADGAFTDVADSNYQFDGQFWHADNSNATFGTLNIPLDFGSGPVTGRRFQFNDANGRLTFVDASNVPTGEFVAPLSVPGGYNPDYQNGLWTFGELAPAYATTDFPVGPFVYDPTTTLKAYRFTWQNLCPLSSGVCTFEQLLTLQAVFIALGPEDFILKFNYQNSFSPAGGVGAFVLGSNSFPPYNGPFTDTGPDYCFHAGVASLCGAAVPSIPEPSPIALLAVGVATWMGLSRRRRSMGTAKA